MEGLLSKKIHKQKYQCILKQAHILQIFLAVNSNDVSSTHHYAKDEGGPEGFLSRRGSQVWAFNFSLKIIPHLQTNPSQNHAHVIQIISN